MSSMTRWARFVRERFPPAQYVPLIVVVALAHVAVLASTWAALPLALVILGMGAFFFKLRLYDEIKDYEDDKQHKPDRPLVRGLVTHRELRAGIVACFAIEWAAFGALGAPGFVGILIAGAYSLLMFCEFFVGRFLRPRLTTYAVTHTVVAGLLTIAVASALLQVMPWELPAKAYALAGASFCLFNVFELARKTWASREEHSGVASYSRIWGRGGAVLLVVAMCACATVLLALFVAHAAAAPLLVAFVVVTIVGGVYAVMDSTRAAAVYRTAAGAYLLGVYVVCAVVG